MTTTRLLADHNCTTPKRCVAKRCTNGCGLYEHTKPGELVEGCLRHDLEQGYVEGGWCGPGLIVQLRAALGRPSAQAKFDSEGKNRSKPGPKVPLNCDAADLLTDIEGHWRQASDDTLRDWRRQARTILGFAVPSMELPDARCLTCGEASFRVARDAASDVWCSNPLCHDSDKHRWCFVRDELDYPLEFGYGTVAARWDCRRTDRSLVHCVTWKRDSWAPLWEQINAGQATDELEKVAS